MTEIIHKLLRRKSKEEVHDVELRFFQRMKEMEREEEEKLATYIEEKKVEFSRVQVPHYKEKIKELSSEEIRLMAQACLAEYALYMRQMGSHMSDGNITTGHRVLGKIIEDLSDAMHNLPRELFSPTEDETFRMEILFFLEFIYVYEDVQPDWLKSSFMFLKAAFPEGFVFVPDVPNANEEKTN